MIDLLYYALAFVLALGVLIVVHEFGHYWVARRLGVKVLRFSVGFGKPLWTRRFGRDRTELVIGALPLGGYVKMLDEHEGDVPRDQLDRAFNRQPVWKRIPIVAAGPFFNFLFAILAYWAVFGVGMEGLRPVVGKVVEGSIAERGGFREGDLVLAFDGKDVQSWGQRRLYLFRKALDREIVNVEVQDGEGRIQHRLLDLREFPRGQVDAALLERGIGLYGYQPQVLPVVGGIEEGPAARAGMREGDRIVAIGGETVEGWEDVVAIVSRSAGRTLDVAVERDGQRVTLQVTPDAVAQDERTIGRINIRPQVGEIPPEMRVQVRMGALEAFREALANTWAMSTLTVEMLYRMVTLEVSSKNISGPITIAQYAGYSAKIGAVQFILFLAVISISLGVLNLLPIPILDGGHLLYYFIEAVKGSPVSERVMAFGHQIGIVVLVGLMVLAFYNDLTRIFQ
ncbi:peptidase [Sulfurifustis variabilis]|uniref:Zinc metalloprotease n=1 Tax=Sulfurifustis variabilis TaxID=1675686 RepID=A0A1B4V3R7_9GAMM|nr:RIP metalloprotease RseP [Sulfurifustis variabilis]BAU48183.1 peptidase [Sulfurifustis variabilis]